MLSQYLNRHDPSACLFDIGLLPLPVGTFILENVSLLSHLRDVSHATSKTQTLGQLADWLTTLVQTEES